MATLESRIATLITALGTDWKDIWAAIGTMANLDTTATDLVEAINEVFAASGGPIALDDLTDVVLTAPDAGHIARHNGTNWVNVLGTTHFDAAGSAAAAQAASQPLDSDLTSIAALTTTAYGRALLELANQAALMALLSSATELAPGVIELATVGEAQTGTDTVRAVTPAGLKAAVDDAKAAILNGAPGALDTLDELAAALGDDANFAATVTTSLSNKQPLDSDLTSIAALTTTSYGRDLLTLANQGALMALLASASETVAGIMEIATQTETNTGTDDARAVTPLKMATRVTALFGNPDADLAAAYATAKA